MEILLKTSLLVVLAAGVSAAPKKCIVSQSVISSYNSAGAQFSNIQWSSNPSSYGKRSFDLSALLDSFFCNCNIIERVELVDAADETVKLLWNYGRCKNCNPKLITNDNCNKNSLNPFCKISPSGCKLRFYTCCPDSQPTVATTSKPPQATPPTISGPRTEAPETTAAITTPTATTPTTATTRGTVPTIRETPDA